MSRISTEENRDILRLITGSLRKEINGPDVRFIIPDYNYGNGSRGHHILPFNETRI